MRYVSLFLLTVLFLNEEAYSQAGTEPAKIYLHTDKDIYLRGETIYFKAYITGNSPTGSSTELYVDLSDETGKLLVQKVFPIITGTADGSLGLPAESTDERLWIRAYTSSVSTRDSSLIYTRKIKIVNGPAISGTQVPKPVSSTVSLRFFPEGGVLVPGVQNTIAFEALGENSDPLSITGIVISSKGDTAAVLTQSHAGMGKFELLPETGIGYKAEWTDGEGNKYKTDLPVIVSNTIALHTEQLPGKLFYILRAPAVNANQESLYITLSNRNEEIFRALIPFKDKFQYSGMIQVGELPPGIFSVAVLDKQQQPLAERLVFLNKDKAVSMPQIRATGKLSKRGRQEIEIEVPDSAYRNMSLSVFDDAFSENSTETIAGKFLLTDELRGRLHGPEYYFQDSSIASNEALDLLLLTHGWRKPANANNASLQDTNSYITIEGTVKALRRNGKLPKQVVLMIKEKGNKGAGSAIPLAVDDQGRFRVTGLVFSDSSIVYCSTGKNKAQSEDYSVELRGGVKTDFLAAVSHTADEEQIMQAEGKNAAGAYPQEYFSSVWNQVKNEKTLSEVTVKARRLTRIEELEQRYSSGFFRGGSASIDIDVMSDSAAIQKMDIHNYLMSRIPGKIMYKDGQKIFQVLLNGGYVTPMVFVNESLVDNELNGISIESIAYIKFIRQYFGTRNDAGTFSPAIAIFLRKGDDLLTVTRPSDLNFTRQEMRGYAITREFYSPDYASFTPPENYTDMRTTLLWKPYVLTAGSETKLSFSFYNNDVSKRLKLVLQGVDELGRFIYQEKIIE